MRAVVFDTFGDPDVLHMRDVALPEPGPVQVRVAIYAAGTNPDNAGKSSGWFVNWFTPSGFPRV